jgi:hypothetical protein
MPRAEVQSLAAASCALACRERRRSEAATPS